MQQVLVFAKVWDTGDKYARACMQQVLVFAKVWDTGDKYARDCYATSASVCEGVGILVISMHEPVCNKC